MTDTSDIDRLAQMLCLALNFEPADELRAGGQTFYRWEGYVPAVRAILHELREPSEGMVSDGFEAILPTFDCSKDNPCEAAVAVWQAMIDHLLGEDGI